MLLKHPLVVWEQQFKAEPESEDEGEPQQSAEDQRWQHGLTLGTERDMETGQRGGGGKNNYWVHKHNSMLVLTQNFLMLLGAERRNNINIQN